MIPSPVGLLESQVGFPFGGVRRDDGCCLEGLLISNAAQAPSAFFNVICHALYGAGGDMRVCCLTDVHRQVTVESFRCRSLSTTSGELKATMMIRAFVYRAYCLRRCRLLLPRHPWIPDSVQATQEDAGNVSESVLCTSAGKPWKVPDHGILRIYFVEEPSASRTATEV